MVRVIQNSLLIVALVSQTPLSAGETTRTADEYPAKMQVGRVTIAAENLGPSVPTPSGGIFTQEYLTIEVAIFGAVKGQRETFNHQQFALRINGSKVPLRPDSPGTVAASLKYPDWERRSRLEASAGAGDGGIILGRPRAVERFPGDRRPAEQRGSGVPLPRVDNPNSRKPETATVDELVQNAALPEGDAALPVTGCLYFAFKGKLKSIKKLELLYEGPLGESSLRFP